ncbi:MAG: glutamine amidotransferase-related protein, partial [Bacteriovorax sp.]
MLDKAKIYVVDFEDSFTFNIAAELFQFEKSIVVVSHLDFFSKKNFNHLINSIKQPIAIILGPGPGSPDEYNDYFKKIELLKEHELVFVMGICLGHQMLALIDGLKIGPSKKPTHGGQTKINFDDKN